MSGSTNVAAVAPTLCGPMKLASNMTRFIVRL
jgi:hypothetical protein